MKQHLKFQSHSVSGIEEKICKHRKEIRSKQIEQEKKQIRQKMRAYMNQMGGKGCLEESQIIQDIEKDFGRIEIVLEKCFLSLKKDISEQLMLEILDLILYKIIEATIEIKPFTKTIHQILSLINGKGYSSVSFLFKVSQYYQAYLELILKSAYQLSINSFNCFFLLKETIWFLSGVSVLTPPEEGILRNLLKLVIHFSGRIDEDNFLILLDIIQSYIEDLKIPKNAQYPNLDTISETMRSIHEFIIFCCEIDFSTIQNHSQYLCKYLHVIEEFINFAGSSYIEIEKDSLEETTLIHAMFTLAHRLPEIFSQENKLIRVHFCFIRVIQIIINFDSFNWFSKLYFRFDLEKYLLLCIFECDSEQLQIKILQLLQLIRVRYEIKVDSEDNLQERYLTLKNKKILDYYFDHFKKVQ